jgi:hypothetical protein
MFQMLVIQAVMEEFSNVTLHYNFFFFKVACNLKASRSTKRLNSLDKIV